MSYILDALRRADAERQRSQAPALQQVAQWPPAGGSVRRPSPWRRIAPWMALALLVLGGAWALGLASLGRSGGPMPVAGASAPMPAAPAPMPSPSLSPPPQPAPAPRPMARMTPAPAAEKGPTTAASGVPPVASLPAPASRTPPVRPPVEAAPAAPVVVAAPAPQAPFAPSAPPSAAPLRPVPVSSLPEPLRGSVTRLGIGGAVHSQDRSQSFVLVGGQIAREGETLAPGITLERIQPRSLWLRVGEQLVEWPL